MAVVIAALNWGCECGWLEYVPKVRKVKTSKLRAAKGRPLTEDEFKRMLAVTGVIVGKESADSWRFLLRGLWESALRLEELMNVSWGNSNSIQPVWESGKHPYLNIPAALQKNDTEESIPLLPWFETLLSEVSEEYRLGWVFNPGQTRRALWGVLVRWVGLRSVEFLVTIRASNTTHFCCRE